DHKLGAVISIEELDQFMEGMVQGRKRKEITEGIYRLSALQQGMLFHGVYSEEAEAYIEQLKCALQGVDVAAFGQSWQHLLNRHSILRSSFHYNEFSIPVQCVYRGIKMPLEIIDYRSLNASEQLQAISNYEAADRARGFDFAEAPLMRVSLLRLDNERYHMVWSWHHLLMDGWSMPVLMEDFLSTYESISKGQLPPRQGEDKYEDYIRFIEDRDKELEEHYWRGYMNGMNEATLLPFIGKTTDRTKGVGIYKEASMQLDASVLEKAVSFAQRHHLTLNTIMQGVWSCLLHSYTGNDHVCFGVTVSGRPDELPDVEKRVGMYINTIPLHTAVNETERITDWLLSIQSAQVLSRQHQYTALQDIREWTGMRGDLF
ncbi:MAG TPA: condensation domain-containing protein, partial [Chitinophagaceae bacterium]|nr:condensation domain-containing protein [Chitinophagaceae bacterium]